VASSSCLSGKEQLVVDVVSILPPGDVARHSKSVRSDLGV